MITIAELLRRSDDALAGLAQRHADLSRYAYTVDQLHRTNVEEDLAYQRTFNGLYGVRRNADWRGRFYRIFEQQKSNADIEFGEVLRSIFESTGRVEASFASKLIATVDPTRAVYDSIVRSNLGLRTRTGSGLEKIADAVDDYQAIQAHLDALIRADRFPLLRQRFDREFPQLKEFTDIKVLDLLIWQIR